MRDAALPLKRDASFARAALAVLICTGVLTLSSYLEVPMFPVPMTMQTLAVTLVGAVLGWRLGALAILVWLGEAAMGLPVLAGDHVAGPLVFVGATAGYLFAFPLAAALCGFVHDLGCPLLESP